MGVGVCVVCMGVGVWGRECGVTGRDDQKSALGATCHSNTLDAACDSNTSHELLVEMIKRQHVPQFTMFKLLWSSLLRILRE